MRGCGGSDGGWGRSRGPQRIRPAILGVNLRIAVLFLISGRSGKWQVASGV